MNKKNTRTFELMNILLKCSRGELTALQAYNKIEKLNGQI